MSYQVRVGLYNDALWKAWLNTVRDYEKNVLQGKSYPSDNKIVKQKKKRYNFLLVDLDRKILEFESEKDFVFFMLSWG